MLLTSFILCFAIVVAEENISISTISPTLELTVTNYPAGTPTKVPIPAPVPARPCYTNLTEVENLVSLKSPFIVETYTLCPNTIFTMGVVDPITLKVTNGWNPIQTRANSIYQCGEDGKSSNNCVISGGSFHMFHDEISFEKEKKENVVVKGITFEDAANGGIILSAANDITFMDCIFRNHQNVGALQLVYCGNCLRRLETSVSMTSHSNNHETVIKSHSDATTSIANLKDGVSDRHNRNSVVAAMQIVTVDGCLFESNARGPDNRFTFSAVIDLTTSSNEISVKNSIFRNNNFAEEGTDGLGYAIAGVKGSKIMIVDTCFTNNLFSGKGVVVVEGGAEDFSATNVYGSLDDKLTCSFASLGDGSCIDYDSTSCTAAAVFDAVGSASVRDGVVSEGKKSYTTNNAFSFILMFVVVSFGL